MVYECVDCIAMFFALIWNERSLKVVYFVYSGIKTVTSILLYISLQEWPNLVVFKLFKTEYLLWIIGRCRRTGPLGDGWNACKTAI